MSLRQILPAALAAFAVLMLPAVAGAFIKDVITAPKTLIDRAIEARSAADIAEDNRIVVIVNGIMAKLGTIKASTEIYEQRLLVTGLFDDRELYDDFKARVEAVEGVKKLYWHVAYMSEVDQEKNADNLLGWDDATILDNKVGVNLVATRGVADVNLRVAVDAFANVYIIGRARSTEERDKTLAVAKETEGAKKIVDYIDIRP